MGRRGREEKRNKDKEGEQNRAGLRTSGIESFRQKGEGLEWMCFQVMALVYRERRQAW